MDDQILQDYRRIPPGIGTSESWRLYRRKVICKSRPVGFFRPDDFVPERFGYEEGIPLYRLDQTKNYSPQSHTMAAQHYYDVFVASQNRHRYSQWDDGKRTVRSVKPGWRTYDKYLSRAKIRDHLRGRDIYGCWGDLWTTWFAVDVDYHGDDADLFLATLPLLDEFKAFFPDVRWFYVLNRNGISGLHLIGLLATPRLLADVHRDVKKVLAYLEEENTATLLKHKPVNPPDDQFHPVANLEIYPATNHNFRLPYAGDRITITDEWLNVAGQVDLKSNLVKFMEYVQDKERQALPITDVIDYIRANIQWRPAKQTKGKGSGTRARSGGGNGRGTINPLKGRHLKFITGVVLGTEALPDDTIGSWAAPALRHLMLVDELGPDEALEKIEGFYRMIPNPSFSDRLSSGDMKELLRTDACTVQNIARDNLYQPRPDESSEIFARVKARCRQIGFVFADHSTWHVLDGHKSLAVDISDMDFSLTFEEKLAVKGPGATILKCDAPSVYQVAHLIKGFVTKYPSKELPASVVPILCAESPINWHVPSDNGARCKKAERFIALMCRLGIIKRLRKKQWFGQGNLNNRAALYGLPQDIVTSDLAKQGPKGSGRGLGEGGRKSIYITDTSAFSDEDIAGFILEVERLNRSWKPQYHSSG